MFVGYVRGKCTDNIVTTTDANKDQVERVLIELGELANMCSVCAWTGAVSIMAEDTLMVNY